MGKPAKKYSQAARLHDVIRLLEARFGMTVDELVEECGVTRRTLYRDLQAISDAGYPLMRERTEGGQVLYRFLTGFKHVPPIIFSLSELMTLYLCRGRLQVLEGTPFFDDLEAVFQRIRSGLPPRSVAHLERIAEAVAPRFQGARDYRPKRQILNDLRQALLFQKRCTLHYAPPHREVADYLFDPYTLLFYQDSLYIVGFAHNRQDLRVFLVDRIQRLEVGEATFTIPESFHIQDVLGSAFGLVDEEPMDIRVRFDAEIAHLIRERHWHPTQELSVQGDGSVVLSLQAGGVKEILAWLYSFLPHVQVLGPDELLQAFRSGLTQALRRLG